MKSLRLLSAVFLAITIASAQAADPKKTDKKPTPAPKAKETPAAKATPAPAKSTSGLPDPVAEMNGKPIKKAELEKEFNSIVESKHIPVEDLSPAQKMEGYRQILDTLISDRLVRAKASAEKVSDEEVTKEIDNIKEQNGIKTPEDFDKALKSVGKTMDGLKSELRVEMQTDKWLKGQFAGKTDVTDADAKTFYDANTDKFQKPESIHVSHILIMTKDVKEEEVPAKEKIAKDIKARLDKGEDFAKLAKELSEDKQTSVNGGDLPLEITRDTQFEPSFLEAAFKLAKVGDTSDIVKTPYGFHIIKLTSKKEAGVATFEEAKEYIIKNLQQVKRRQVFTELMAGLRKDAKVKIYLPPAPEPTAPSADAPGAPGAAPEAPAPGGDAPPAPAPGAPAP